MKYVHSRKNWKLILEARDNRDKIKKFINFNPNVADWAHEIDTNYSLWIANSFKDELIKKVEEEGIYEKEIDGRKATKSDVLDIIKNGADENDKFSNSVLGFIKTIGSRLIEKSTPKYRYVIDWTRARLRDANERIDLKGISLEEAWNKSDEWHKAIAEGEYIIVDEEGEIIMTFKDDFYWIDLQTDSCSEEGKAMGHCGETTYGTTLYSLRKNKKPYVTIAFNENDRNNTQAKGRGNEKPIDKYHPYIVDLLINPSVDIQGFDYEYNPQGDFQLSDLNDELFEKLYKGNKQIFDNSKGYTTLILLKRGLMEKKDATEGLSDVVYDEETNELYFVVGEWGDTADLVFEDTNSRSTLEFTKSILSGDYDSVLYFDSDEKFDFSNHWEYLTVDTLKAVKEVIIENQDGTFYDTEGDEREFTFTEENLIVDTFLNAHSKLTPGEKLWNAEKKAEGEIGGMYFYLDEQIFDMADILNDNRDSGWIEDIVDNFNNAARDAERWSIENKWFEKISEMVIDKLTNNSDKEDKTRYKFFDEKLGFKLDPAYIIDIMERDDEGESFNYNSI